MRRILVLCTVPAIVATTANALTASVVAGYGLPFPGSTMGNKTSGTTEFSTTEVVTGSFADGIHAGGAIGARIGDFTRLELGARYERSSKITSSTDYSSATSTSEDVTNLRLSQFAFLPSVVLTFPRDGLRPYARFQGHIGFPSYIATATSDYVAGGATYSHSETVWEYYGGVAWGVGGGFGAEYALSPRLSLIGEIVSDNWTWAPNRAKKTKHIQNGVDVLSTESVSQTRRTYSDKYSRDLSTPEDSDQPTKGLRSYRAYSALSLNLGLQTSF